MRYSVPRVIFFFVVVWMCCTVSDTLAQQRFDDITITPGLQPTGDTSHGYAEYRIAVSNYSPDKTHQVTLILPKSVFGVSGNRIREITRSVIVGPSATVHVSLLQPPVLLASGSELGIAIDGEIQREEVLLSGGQHGRMGARVKRFPLSLRILISRNVDTTALHLHVDTLLSPLSSISRSPPGGGFPRSGGGGAPYQTIDLGLPVSEWSTNWLGFSRYDGVIVTDEDVRQMPPDVQSALWRYVECGGALLVLGGRELPESWGLKESLKSELHTGAGIAVYDVSFGQCIVSSGLDTKNLGQSQWRWVVESWLKTTVPWRSGISVEEANRMFPVVNKLGIPVRGLFLLMLLFVVVIGPANLIVLSHKKRRIWMLWTTPVISLITCLAVFAYATFAEGWNRHARTDGLTLLDERSQRATTIGWTAFYSGLTPSDGLHFGYESELTPLAESMTTNIARTIDWTHDQHLANGWVTARVPAHFMVRKSEMRRERITVRRGTDADLKVVNGLGADINQFWLADRDGTLYSATDIPAGVEAALTPFEKESIGGSDEILLFEAWIPLVNQELDKGNITGILRDEMESHGILLSDNVTVSIEQDGRQWRITDWLLERSYNIKTSKTEGPFEIYGDRQTSLRGIFASENWIKNIEGLKINPQRYLRPGCYIATLDASPFIEEGLQKVTEKRYSSIVYGILAEE
jgi:hypothetical protein